MHNKYEWFLKDGRREYDGMIDKVIQHKSMLTSTNQSLERIVGCTFVLGKAMKQRIPFHSV